MIYTAISLIALLVFFITYVIKNIGVQNIDRSDPECQQVLLDIKRYKILGEK